MADDTQHQLREWLARKLAENGRGARARLAEALEINREAITKIFKPPRGQSPRRIQANELRGMAKFFNETPPGFSEEEILNPSLSLSEAVLDLSPEEQEQVSAFLTSLIAKRNRR